LKVCQKTGLITTKESRRTAPPPVRRYDEWMDVNGEIPHLSAIRFTGAEAAQFLQGQISHDTQRLNDGAALLACLNSPQGRVLSVLTFLPHSSGIVGILPRELLAATVESLRKYVMRAKVKIEDAGEAVRVAGVHGRAALAGYGLAASIDGKYLESNGIGTARLNIGDERYWIIGDGDSMRAVDLIGNAADAAERERAWRLADIRAGRPQVYAATREIFVAQMLNLDLIDGISFTKGCYTGQEIIARTQHLGRIKRRMFRLRVPRADWLVGQTVGLTDGRSGRIVESAAAPDAHEILAVLPLERAAEIDQSSPLASSDADAARAVGVDAQVLPLPYPIRAGAE
jgi:tRNA-modifying protein YgfZ